MHCSAHTALCGIWKPMACLNTFANWSQKEKISPVYSGTKTWSNDNESFFRLYHVDDRVWLKQHKSVNPKCISTKLKLGKGF